jgi:two-component sensor histidine kinase
VTRDLARHGFEVTHAPSGADGVRLLGERQFDLVALDHNMPQQDGLETLGQIKALPAPPPVVYVTGSEDSRLAVAALKAGAVDYVIKASGRDFFDLLRSALDQALRQLSMSREAEAAAREIHEANERLEALVAQQQILMREVNHRVANSLQIIASLVRMQAGSLEDDTAREALRDTQHRIEAIMQVHRRLYTSSDVEVVEMDKYLEGLVAELEQSMAAAGHQHQITVRAEPVTIPTDKAVSVGVIVTELVTNAYKYAYPPGQTGPIRVGLNRAGADLIELGVEDDGVGIPSVLAQRGTGLGQKVIRAMASGLGSEIVVDPAHRGTRVSIAFSL